MIGGGGGEALSSPPPNPGRSRRASLELFSARIPFRLKVVAVWGVILALLVALFAAADFDVAWMRENAAFIAKGITWSMIIAVLSIALACVLALLASVARGSG